MKCQRCTTTLYPEDIATAPHCDLCHAHIQAQAERDRSLTWTPRQHTEPPPPQEPAAEPTTAGLNYLLPGVAPLHQTPQGAGQSRLF